jgi:thymidylate kinase
MQLIAIFGPTGVGKTAIAIELAEQLRERGEDPVWRRSSAPAASPSSPAPRSTPCSKRAGGR